MKNTNLLTILFLSIVFAKTLSADSSAEEDEYITIFNSTYKSQPVKITWIKHDHHGDHKKHTKTSVEGQATTIIYSPDDDYTYAALQVLNDEPHGSRKSYIGKDSSKTENRYFILQPQILGFKNKKLFEQIVTAFEN
jgi:hypothetical protein